MSILSLGAGDKFIQNKQGKTGKVKKKNLDGFTRIPKPVMITRTKIFDKLIYAQVIGFLIRL